MYVCACVCSVRLSRRNRIREEIMLPSIAFSCLQHQRHPPPHSNVLGGPLPLGSIVCVFTCNVIASFSLLWSSSVPGSSSSWYLLGSWYLFLSLAMSLRGGAQINMKSSLFHTVGNILCGVREVLTWHVLAVLEWRDGSWHYCTRT